MHRAQLLKSILLLLLFLPTVLFASMPVLVPDDYTQIAINAIKKAKKLHELPDGSKEFENVGYKPVQQKTIKEIKKNRSGW